MSEIAAAITLPPNNWLEEIKNNTEQTEEESPWGRNPQFPTVNSRPFCFPF